MDNLKFIAEQMENIAVPYEFGEWSSPVQYPYFVGELTEEPTMTEDGYEESTLLLTGFHRGTMLDLLRIRERIKNHFCTIHGLRGRTESGSIAAYFDGSFFVPTGEAGLRKIQINIKIKEWKGAK